MMSEQEKLAKVIKGLECCIIRDPDDKMRCSECPYKDPNTYCLNRLKMDALALLKEDRETTCGPDYCEIEFQEGGEPDA